MNGAALDALVASWPVGSAAVGTLDLGALEQGPNWQFGRPDQIFPWASVSKLATALALLVAVEEGTCALDDAVGPSGSTLRHLLAHASGISDESSVPVAPPGTERIYSSRGYEDLAHHLERRSGMPFAAYLTESVLVPLGMHGARLEDHPSGQAAAGLAGTLDDLLRLASAWASPVLISRETWTEAVTPAYPTLGGIVPGFGRFDPCPWGLGPEIRGEKAPHWTGSACSVGTYGHFGASGSFLWIDPEAGIALAGLSNQPFGPWSARAWPQLAAAVLADPFQP